MCCPQSLVSHSQLTLSLFTLLLAVLSLFHQCRPKDLDLAMGVITNLQEGHILDQMLTCFKPSNIQHGNKNISGLPREYDAVLLIVALEARRAVLVKWQA